MFTLDPKYAVLSTVEVGRLLGKSRFAVRRLILSQKIRGFQWGRLWFVTPVEVVRFYPKARIEDLESWKRLPDAGDFEYLLKQAERDLARVAAEFELDGRVGSRRRKAA